MSIPTMTIPVPSVDDLELDQFIPSSRSAKDLVARRQTLKKQIEEAEKELQDIDIELGTALDFRGAKNAVWEDYLIIRRQGAKPRALLDRVLLMEAGVTPQQLEAGTKFSEQGKPGITVQSISKGKTAGSYTYDSAGILCIP